MNALKSFALADHPSAIIIVDASPLQGRDNERGIARYVADLIHSLSEDPQICVFARTVPYLPHPVGLDDQRIVIAVDHEIRKEVTRLNLPTAYVVSSPFLHELRPTDVIPRWLISLGIPTVGLVYDVIPALFPEIYLSEDLHKRAYFGRFRLIETCEHFVSISHSAAADFARLSGIDRTRITVIGTGSDSRRFSPDAARLAVETETSFLRRIDYPRAKIVLYVAGQDGRKNVGGLIEAWSKVFDQLPGHRLVVACHVPQAVLRTWKALVEEHDVDSQSVFFTGRITDSQLLALYGAADFQVFASLYEGFGLPIAEAASCGLVSISGNNSSLPEVLGPEFCKFDANDPSGMSRAIYELATDSPELEALRLLLPERCEAFSWIKVREKFLQALQRIGSPPTSNQHFASLRCEVRSSEPRSHPHAAFGGCSPRQDEHLEGNTTILINESAFDRLVSDAHFDAIVTGSESD